MGVMYIIYYAVAVYCSPLSHTCCTIQSDTQQVNPGKCEFHNVRRVDVLLRVTRHPPIRGVWYKIFVDQNRVPLSFRDAQTQQISVEGVLRLQPRVPNVNL